MLAAVSPQAPWSASLTSGSSTGDRPVARRPSPGCVDCDINAREAMPCPEYADIGCLPLDNSSPDATAALSAEAVSDPEHRLDTNAGVATYVEEVSENRPFQPFPGS